MKRYRNPLGAGILALFLAICICFLYFSCTKMAMEPEDSQQEQEEQGEVVEPTDLSGAFYYDVTIDTLIFSEDGDFFTVYRWVVFAGENFLSYQEVHPGIKLKLPENADRLNFIFNLDDSTAYFYPGRGNCNLDYDGVAWDNSWFWPWELKLQAWVKFTPLEPYDMDVILNGVSIGSNQDTQECLEGLNTVSARRVGYNDSTFTFSGVLGDTIVIPITLIPESSSTFLIQSNYTTNSWNDTLIVEGPEIYYECGGYKILVLNGSDGRLIYIYLFTGQDVEYPEIFYIVIRQGNKFLIPLCQFEHYYTNISFIKGDEIRDDMWYYEGRDGIPKPVLVNVYPGPKIPPQWYIVERGID